LASHSEAFGSRGLVCKAFRCKSMARKSLVRACDESYAIFPSVALITQAWAATLECNPA
jgi:hypothetical protein